MSVHPIRQAAAAVAEIADTFDSVDGTAVASVVKREMETACEACGVRLVEVFAYLREQGGRR